MPLLRLLRPEQWVKNLLVLAPWVFAGLSRNLELGLRALTAAVIFTVASALVYVFNDYMDVDRDRLHPVKRNTRPIAAGLVAPRTALWTGAGLFLLVATSAIAFPSVLPVIAAYVAIGLLYTPVLKHIAIIDLLAVAAGYLLRVYAGAEAVYVPLSGWMASATVFLSLFLVSSKRYAELSSGETRGREVLSNYSPGFLNFFHWLAGAATFTCYVLYVVLVHPELISTIPVVALGLARYAWLTQSLRRRDSPADMLLEDMSLLATVMLWGVMCVVILR